MPAQAKDRPWTRAAIAWIEQTFHVSGYGYASSGHVSNSDHYTGNAIDADVPGLADGLGHAPAGTARDLGDRIAQWFLQHPTIYGTKYVIWNHTITYPDGRSHAYTGSNDHTGHVHISFDGTGGTGQTAAAPASTASPAGLWDGLTGDLAGQAKRLTIEAVIVAAAAVLVVLGVIKTAKPD